MRTTILFLGILVFSLPAWGQEDAYAQRANHYLDHIVLAINDLDRGMDEIHRRTGVRPRFDGRNARFGTHSAVIALGEEAFLEIVAPDPKADPEAIDEYFRPFMLDRIEKFETLTPFLWAIGTSNLKRTLRFVGRAGSRPSDIYQGERKRSWGRRTNWTWAHVYRPVSNATPIFVQWDSETKPPQDRAPGGCELTSFQITTRNFKPLHALIAVTQVDAEPTGAANDSLAFTLECEGEAIDFDPVPLLKIFATPLNR